MVPSSPAGALDGERVVAPDQNDYAVDDQGEAEGDQADLDVRPVLEPAEEDELERGADDREAERRDDQRDPETHFVVTP